MSEKTEAAKPTHIILNIEDVNFSANPERDKIGKRIAERLFRTSDGVMIAERYADVGDDLVIYGEDSTETKHRRFINAKAAAMFMRNLPRVMQNEIDPPPHPKDFPSRPVDFDAALKVWQDRQPAFLIDVMRRGIIDPKTPAVSEKVQLN